jgi:hypothetical protein
VLISKYITGTDRPYCSRKDCFKLDASFNTRYAVKYYVFALILVVCRAGIITNPTIHMSSYPSNEDVCMVGLVIIRARHTAKIRAKSLIVS